MLMPAGLVSYERGEANNINVKDVRDIDIESAAAEGYQSSQLSSTDKNFGDEYRGTNKLADNMTSAAYLYGFITNTGQWADLRTRSATLPSRIFSIPRLPWVPMMIMWAFWFLA